VEGTGNLGKSSICHKEYTSLLARIELVICFDRIIRCKSTVRSRPRIHLVIFRDIWSLKSVFKGCYLIHS
jgi:hypothetical protein